VYDRHDRPDPVDAPSVVEGVRCGLAALCGMSAFAAHSAALVLITVGEKLLPAPRLTPAAEHNGWVAPQ
jgi:hypothetical protein